MPLGSYRLGVVSPSTDIDILCLSVMSQQEFFMTIQEFTPNVKDIKVLRVSAHTDLKITKVYNQLHSLANRRCSRAHLEARCYRSQGKKGFTAIGLVWALMSTG